MMKKRIWWFLSFVGLALGLCLVFEGSIFDLLHPLIFSAAGDLRTDGIFRFLSPILFNTDRALGDWCLLGLPLSFLGLAGMVITQPAPRSMAGFIDRNRIGLAALGVAIAANILVFVSSVGFFFVPAGENIRPMGWTLMLLAIAGVTFVVVVPLALIARAKEKNPSLVTTGILLSIAPYGLGSMMLGMASWMKGFTLGD